jgi:hypothetical protein
LGRSRTEDVLREVVHASEQYPARRVEGWKACDVQIVVRMRRGTQLSVTAAARPSRRVARRVALAVHHPGRLRDDGAATCRPRGRAGIAARAGRAVRWAISSADNRGQRLAGQTHPPGRAEVTGKRVNRASARAGVSRSAGRRGSRPRHAAAGRDRGPSRREDQASGVPRRRPRRPGTPAIGNRRRNLGKGGICRWPRAGLKAGRPAWPQRCCRRERQAWHRLWRPGRQQTIR